MRRVTLFPLMLSLFLVAPLQAQPLCPVDKAEAAAHADTISINHWNAERNCCFELAVEFTVAAGVVDFFEGETGEPCHCDCCFDLSYSACGFAAGHYTVRVWNGDGTELYATLEVDVSGEANTPEIIAASLGKCTGPTPIGSSTWTLTKKLFR